jgi:hypothetical protein
MKKFLGIFILILFLLLVGCSGAADSYPSYYRDLLEGDLYYDYDSSSSSKGYVEGEGGEENDVTLQAGQLTASATFDNQKFDFWKGLITSNQEGDGLFKAYDERFAFKTKNRITLTFPKGTYARVDLVEKDNVKFTSYADASGVCYIFSDESKENYKLNIEYLDKDNNMVTLEDEVSGDKEYTIEALDKSRDLIEIMFVIDATGSMDDEMRYLNAEIVDVIKKVKQDNGNVRILVSTMVYRDKGDDYVTRYSDFTEDVNKQIEFLGKQRADGGGDFEEAVQTALKEASEKQWTTSASTKILVHVQDVNSWNETVKVLASKGICILTVASSGITKKTEYFFRCQSLITNGVYVHLTNDSGIGGDHIEATVDEKEEVELLNDCLVRIINGMHSGEYASPINWRQSQSKPAE